MSKYTGIPFRHDVVGSFLRPQAIHDARRAFEAGTLTAEELRAIEDREIKALVEKEKANGLQAVTDGEFRRTYWHLDFLEFIVRPLPGTPAAAEGAAQSGLALFGVEYPGPILPGWSVAHMLSVTTGQDCHPVAVLVLTKINDTHSPFVRVRVAIVGGLG